MDIELHDWEVLDDSTTTTTTTTIPLNPTTGYLDGIEHDSEGMIKSNHFSLDVTPNYSVTPVVVVDDISDHVSVESDNPSWIDPICDTNYTITKPIGEVSSTDSEDDGRYVGNNELGVVEIEERGRDRHDELVSDSSVEIESKTSVCKGIDEKIGEEVVKGREGGDERGKVGVWWKIPLDLVKYCLFKASPVWSLSVAAAMMGVVILGRRLYKMKQKTRTLQLKVAVDDKKVSQVMSRAARLNEAFSIVKRGPIIRPSLPAAGIAPWPVMALR